MQAFVAITDIFENSMAKPSNQDLQKIHAKIDHVADQLKLVTAPHKWKNPTFLISLFTLVATIIALPIMLASWIEPHLHNDLRNDVTIETQTQLKDTQKQINDMAGDISAINGQLKVLEPLIQDMIAKQMRSAATLSPDQLKDVAQLARERRVKIAPADVANAGNKVLQEAKTNPKAWDATLAVLDYRSLLNADFTPTISDPRISSLEYVAKTQIIAPKGETNQQVYESQQITLGGTADAEHSARMELLSESRHSSSALFMVFEMDRKDNELLLDGLYLKNVIIKDVTVAYRGGPVKLDNVYFVNCKFDFKSAPETRELAGKILSSPAITFDKAA